MEKNKQKALELAEVMLSIDSRLRWIEKLLTYLICGICCFGFAWSLSKLIPIIMGA